jgi:hypothetical protein
MNGTNPKGSAELTKDIGELFKSAGPTDEHRQAFGRTFLGTLLGQTVVLIGLIVTYLVALALIWRFFFEDLAALQAAVGAVWFWLIVVSPFICILLFSMLPTAMRARRERRMKDAIISGDAQFDAFRLYPYGEADRSDFRRLDGADNTILSWLSSTRSSVLYFSGASGVGKSSLLSASVLPALRDKGWIVVETRLFGDPIEQLRTALIAVDPRFARKVQVGHALRDILENIVEARRRREASPLLLVIDQFEEFLILHKEIERLTFTNFLVDLSKKPIAGLRLLLVFRSDYRPLIFKMDLPRLLAGENWNELSAYDHNEASTFLRTGGRNLAPEAFDRLFRGLDRIEDTPGMYRLITLNMVGLVLERMGSRLQSDPGRLIQSYLTACLKTGEARDYAQPLLSQMITDAGTKEPRTESDLVAATGFASWQVKATLAELARQGLVRPLAEEMWEIAHDFLARLTGQLIGRLRPGFAQRMRPLVAPIVLLGWIAFAAIAWPYLASIQERSAEAALRRLGARLGATSSGGMEVELELARLNEAATYLKVINPHSLQIIPSQGLSEASPTSSLDPIKDLINLRSLTITASNELGSIEPISGLTNLTSLSIRSNNFDSLEPIRRLTSLVDLRMVRTNRFLTNFPGIYVGSAFSKEPATLEPINRLTKLRSLRLENFSRVKSIEPLGELTNLTELSLNGAAGITTLEPLKRLTSLNKLDIRATNVKDLEPLRELASLKELNLSATQGVVNVEPLAGLRNLRVLHLSRAVGVINLNMIDKQKVTIEYP